MTTHDSSFQSQTPTIPRRRRALSTATTGSISTSKRSPSPRILSPDATGVQNITRKVIRKLEGLGHLDSTDMFEQESETDDILEETPLPANGSAKPVSQPLHDSQPSPRTNGAASPSTQPVKIDWEIPRKVFHSSIGELISRYRIF